MTKGIIERAFELAPECENIEAVRSALKREGYSNIDAHLSGPSLRGDLKKLFLRAS